jgi:peroxiredoxin
LGLYIGKFIYIIRIQSSQPDMKKRTRLEIYGISDDTKSSLKEIAKAENVPTGVLVEPVLRRYVREYRGG